jgi:hypothetical protein
MYTYNTALNVAIGTTDPAGNKLRVAGSLRVDGAINGINFTSGSAGTWANGSLLSGQILVIPAGTYIWQGFTPSYCYFQIYTGSTWSGGGNLAGLVVSDGVNYRLNNAGSASSTYSYRKLA